MKNNKYILLLGGLLFLSSGCHDNFLSEDVYSSITTDNFYQTEADIQAGVISVYNAFKLNDTYKRELWLAAEYPGDASSANKSGVSREELDEYKWTESNTGILAVWGGLYKAINRANVLLANIDKVEFNTPGLKDQLVGETKFLRGFAYLTLIRFFDHIPCMTEKNLDELYPSNEGTDDAVWQLIVSDLQYAVSILPAKYKSTETGKATAGAAQTMLAKAYITMAGFPWNKTEYWAKAVEELNKIMQNSQYGYALEPDFEKIFLINNKHGVEYIYSIESEKQLGGMGNDYSIFSGIRGGNRFQQNGWSSITAEVPFFESMGKTDKRRNKTFVLSYPDYKDPDKIYTYPETIALLHYNKLIDPEDFKTATGSGDLCINFPVTRFADVLLMHSEAVNEVGGPGAEAVRGINMVRQRAGLEPLEPSKFTKETLRDAIVRERTWEFAEEGYAYFDLKRTKSIEKRIKPLGFDVQPKHYVFPIPQNELDANSNLVQNSEYK